jgi:hypothetical protein
MRWPPVEKSCPVDMGNGGRKKNAGYRLPHDFDDFAGKPMVS